MSSSSKQCDCECAADLIAREFSPEVAEYLASGQVPGEVCDCIYRTCNEVIRKDALQAQFVSDVSHEIRTPLTAIRGAAETLLDGDVPPDMAQRFLTQIVRECDRLTRLANDLLTLQRAEGNPMELTRINLRMVADNCALLMEGLLEERGVELAIVGEAADINGNADAINQILVNLIENASRYAGSGGHVRVELATLKGNSVIAVKDDGEGFGDEDPAHLFDRFYRADQSRVRHKGTGNSGLGLAIVKALAEKMDGHVQAANLPQRGAVFIVAFPGLEPEE